MYFTVILTLRKVIFSPVFYHFYFIQKKFPTVEHTAVHVFYDSILHVEKSALQHKVRIVYCILYTHLPSGFTLKYLNVKEAQM